jgi:E3 ubiquitin-protein ligase BIG BROTHER-like protein
MDGSSKRIDGGGADKSSPDDGQNQNASPNVPASAAGDDGASAAAAAAAAAALPAEGRRPFTSLSQEEADLALARVLQEQVSAGDLAGSVAPGPIGACYETSPLIPRALCRSGRT